MVYLLRRLASAQNGTEVKLTEILLNSTDPLFADSTVRLSQAACNEPNYYKPNHESVLFERHAPFLVLL